jgi:hypothetical protein
MEPAFGSSLFIIHLIAQARHDYGYDNASRLETVTDALYPDNSAVYSYLANSSLIEQITFKRVLTSR